jgi:hypothetical protein
MRKYCVGLDVHAKLYGALLAVLKHGAYRPRMGEW